MTAERFGACRITRRTTTVTPVEMLKQKRKLEKSKKCVLVSRFAQRKFTASQEAIASDLPSNRWKRRHRLARDRLDRVPARWCHLCVVLLHLERCGTDAVPGLVHRRRRHHDGVSSLPDAWQLRHLWLDAPALAFIGGMAGEGPPRPGCPYTASITSSAIMMGTRTRRAKASGGATWCG